MSGRRSAVTWLDWNEWQNVHTSLFCRDVFEQQRAISRVAAWRSRAQLPVAINATAQLVELQLHASMAQHHHHAVGVSSRSHMELSLLYSNAIVRCVNGLVDGSQKGAYALAVSTLAQRIGIPLWVVDLRHESTHNQLPSLPVLRFAARHLLAWLRVNYWTAQESLLSGQVHLVAHWLFQQLPHLTKILNEKMDPAQEPIAPMLDAEKLRNIVIPLLVGGEQYCVRIASIGLLFLRAQTPQKVHRSDQIFQKEVFITLILQLQPIWRSFSASLLAALGQKVFKAICPPQSSEEDGKVARENEHTNSFQQIEVDGALHWIKFMVSSEYRERIKLQIAPIEDICQCGAEMLALAENFKADDIAKYDKCLLDRVMTVLRSSKGIRNHVMVATKASISIASQIEKWTKLAAWGDCPIGLRHGYASYDQFGKRQLREFIPDDDILMSDSTTFVETDDELEEGLSIVDPNDAEIAIDALMEEWDKAYDSEIQHILDLQATIARDGHRQGISETVLPKQELQRIQKEIEIW